MRKKKPAKFSNRRYDKECMALAKKIVRIRDNLTCQKCWSKKSPQCSHVYSDGRDRRLSVDPMNMKILCMSCHLYRRHKEPLEAYERYKSKFPDRYKYLEKKHIENMKWWSISLQWREDTYNDLLNQAKKYNIKKSW